MFELIKITALYSNAVLTAILPHISDFAQRAELRSEPITTNEVRTFYCDPRKDEVGGRIILSNGWQFWFLHGCVDRFETPLSYFSLQNPDRVPEFFGPVNMDADEALALGQRIISRLNGSGIEKILGRSPRITGPIQTKGGTVPRYRIEWPRGDVSADWTGSLGMDRMESGKFMARSDAFAVLLGVRRQLKDSDVAGIDDDLSDGLSRFFSRTSKPAADAPK
jgi:hypothetical protein